MKRPTLNNDERTEAAFLIEWVKHVNLTLNDVPLLKLLLRLAVAGTQVFLGMVKSS